MKSGTDGAKAPTAGAPEQRSHLLEEINNALDAQGVEPVDAATLTFMGVAVRDMNDAQLAQAIRMLPAMIHLIEMRLWTGRFDPAELRG